MIEVPKRLKKEKQMIKKHFHGTLKLLLLINRRFFLINKSKQWLAVLFIEAPKCSEIKLIFVDKAYSIVEQI